MTLINTLVTRVNRRLPAPLRAAPLVVALEAMRRAGWLEPPEALDGRTFSLTVDDMGLEVRFHCRDGQFRMGPFDGAGTDLTLHAGALSYLHLISGDADTDTLFFQRRLSIRGDTALGLEVKYWLDAAPRPDWLGPLARRLTLLFPEPRPA
ncbi:ubiquinone anaerobic biosynthesis accessory factor UbiT [Cupriavidus agavae]|uniref:Putative lipid carrier protein YhbT n=1 Tax=Cupriavidus agavae TaxID=1001822 RepID=A0A4Q7S086_9BURK|nr:SCP2 sterol-binding domain-containing protein [Cupriavidus agavae]RZT39551.1 putative lipid carrier protein YhbT [Cupriavidus agavae]